MDEGLRLQGRTVGVTADRRAREQIGLLERRGAHVLHGPTMRTVDLTGASDLRAATEALVARPPSWLVATTGMGMRAWLETAGRWGLLDDLLAALRGARAVARGAKSASVLRAHGLDVAWRAPGETMAEVVAHVADRARPADRVALQLYDPDDRGPQAALAAPADVVPVPVYRWVLPQDPAPVQRLIAAAVDGGLDAVTFTSQPAVRFLFRLAEDAGRGDALRAAMQSTVLPVCVGPVCAEALTAEGVTRGVWPEPARLAPMVRLVAEHLGPAPSAA